MVDMEPVASDRISEYGYDTETATVYVTFKKDGVHWQYRQVPDYVWDEFRQAPSKGRFIHDCLDHYDHGPA
jgi:hypothetical protein